MNLFGRPTTEYREKRGQSKTEPTRKKAAIELQQVQIDSSVHHNLLMQVTIQSIDTTVGSYKYSSLAECW